MKSLRRLGHATIWGAILFGSGCSDILSPHSGSRDEGRPASSGVDELVTADNVSGAVALIREDGSVIRRFEHVENYPHVVAWTSDRARVLLTGEGYGLYALLLDVSTGQTTLLANGWASIFGLRLVPHKASEDLVFIGRRLSSDKFSEWRISTAGGTPVRIGPYQAPRNPVPSIASPDGNLVASLEPDGLWVRRSDGSASRNLTSSLSSIGVQSVSWSPDGHWLAFNVIDFAYFPARYDIYRVDTDGSGLRNLTAGEAPACADPVISPDGKLIAFYASATPETWDHKQTYVMESDGTGRRKISEEGVFIGTAPKWSPDGEQLAFWNGEGLVIVRTDGRGTWSLPGFGFTLLWRPRI